MVLYEPQALSSTIHKLRLKVAVRQKLLVYDSRGPTKPYESVDLYPAGSIDPTQAALVRAAQLGVK